MKTTPILSHQGYASTERVASPCQRTELPLLLFCRALIDQATMDAIRGFRNGEPSDLSRDAMEWITSEERDPASFLWCTSWLNFDGPAYRKQLVSEIWQARLALCGENHAAVRGRFKSYSFRQTRQYRRPLADLIVGRSHSTP